MSIVTISKSVNIAAPVESVFAAMTDWPRQSEWMLGTSVKGVHRAGQGVDGTIVARTALGPFGFSDSMTITEWQPPYRCAVVHTGRLVRGKGLLLVKESHTDTSIFTWSEEIILPFGAIGRIGWTMIRPLATVGLSWSCVGLNGGLSGTRND